MAEQNITRIAPVAPVAPTAPAPVAPVSKFRIPDSRIRIGAWYGGGEGA